ncbi:unnamed protein product [Schistocephalus solidus]|uniref:Uncharacterized protein n=1 Tax=Schistocephalus solidus TaxID=70667 RepID=A0A183TTP2_SCHSO|nr:unnamed protein product [Schistocephalus solidus]
MRIAEHAAAVRRNDTGPQVAAHSTGPSHTFNFDQAEILARGDNHVGREPLEVWFSGPQSINKCNDLPVPYSALRLCLGKVVSHAEKAWMATVPGANVGEPQLPKSSHRMESDRQQLNYEPSLHQLRPRAMSVGTDNLDKHAGAQQQHDNCIL